MNQLAPIVFVVSMAICHLSDMSRGKEPTWQGLAENILYASIYTCIVMLCFLAVE